MLKFLARIFIKDYENVQSQKVRTQYGVLGCIVGVIVNIILSALKFLVGTLSGSISITADAVNNLSDAASSIVSLIGFKISARPADKQHPFGHGRVEYITALIVSFVILWMGVELIRSSIQKIISPQAVTFSLTALTIIIVSILCKIGLAFFNISIAKRTNSPANRAAAADCISDTAATTVSLISLIVAKFSSLPIDGYLGIIVALFILYTGFNILKQTINSLVGSAPDKELVEKILDTVTACDDIIAVHDLIIHNYGPNNFLASAHAEICDQTPLVTAHEKIDEIESIIKIDFGIDIVIHVDPVPTKKE